MASGEWRVRDRGTRGKCKQRRESLRAHRVAWVESARVRVSARARSHRIKQQVAELCESWAAVIPLSPALLTHGSQVSGRQAPSLHLHNSTPPDDPYRAPLSLLRHSTLVEALVRLNSLTTPSSNI